MDWSPFYCLPQASLTLSGLLKLDSKDHEVELIRRSKIELRHDSLEPMGKRPEGAARSEKWNPRSEDLTVTITTHRLVLFNSKNQARFLHLSNLMQTECSGGPTFLHPKQSFKLALSTYQFGDLILVFRSSVAEKDRDEANKKMKTALQRRAWEAASRLEEKKLTNVSIAKRRVGVDHILTKNKLRHRQAARLADQALSGDSEQLLQEASELLGVIQKYVALLQKQQQSSDSQENADAQQLASLLQDMGMTSALTKTQVSSKRGGGHDEYYELLARQVADFLLPKLKQMGGVLTLTDVFCLFNRARGSNLVSPDDLGLACQLLSSLNLGISKRTFPSGIVVVQLDSMNKTDELVGLCPTTALEASHVLKLSPLLAMEQLEEAERFGLLCRDVTHERICFFANRFDLW